MDPSAIGVLGIIVLLILIALGVNLGVALLTVGVAGVIVLIGLRPGLVLLGSGMYSLTAVYIFCALPVFILMGSFAFRGGFAKGAYEALHNWVQKLPGALALATTVACGAFGAVTGSSTATVAIFGKITLPEMTKHNYKKSLSLGCIAASGTFATMIPPSGLLILYGLFTEQSIGKLFMAGIIPGVLTVFVYSLSIVARVMRSPELAPRSVKKPKTWREKVISLRLMWPIIILATIVLGGIFTGLFTVTESAAIGAVLALIIAIQQKGLRGVGIRSALRETAHTTAMIFLIIIGALFFARFLALSQIPFIMAEFLETWAVPRVVVMAAILGMYFILGMFINAAGMIAITMPMIFPLVLRLGYDPIWFGIIVIKLCEIGFVTPPVGLNVYVLSGTVADQASLQECFAGIWPFVLCDIAVVVFLIAFPQIVLLLPNMMLAV